LLAAALAAAAFLRTFRLDSTGQNLYYAAGVRSMLDSWHNFFYVSFEPGGSLMIDKPPLGLWLQTASAWLFGFHYWALAVPQVVAGIAAVALVWAVVRPRYGPWVAALSALGLAALPASVASARNNSLDTITMLLMVAAGWGVLRAGERQRFRYLAFSAVLAGLAFNTKMFEAFVPLPAFAFAYTVSIGNLRRSLTNLLLAFVLLAAVSLSWVTVVGLTPADSRPHIQNGFGDNVWSLTFRYNGLNRIVGSQPQSRVRGPSSETADSNLGAASLAPRPGPVRLIWGTMGSQIGWFIPLALGGWLYCLRKVRNTTSRESRASTMLWATWFFSGLLFFSVNSSLKPQYLESIAAPLVVGSAIALERLCAGSGRKWPVAVLLLCGVGTYHSLLMMSLADDTRRLGATLLVLFAGVAAWALFKLLSNTRVARRTPTAAPVALAVLLFVGPLTWSYATAAEPATGSATRYPTAGPDDVRDYPAAPGGDSPMPGSATSATDPVLAFLEANTVDMEYIVATERSLYGNAARYILLTNRPVLTLDVYSDEAEAAAELARLVASGRLRFVELQQEGPWADTSLALGRWFAANCTDITKDGLRPLGGDHIYDCAAGAATVRDAAGTGADGTAVPASAAPWIPVRGRRP
jgi:4-amino-4-deoxy-L-arabinose transferase-like glycosyltransferase